MKKRNFKSLKLNKNSISKLSGNSIEGGNSYVYTNLCTLGCTNDCSNNCPETEACPSSWIYLCNDCDATTEPLR